MNFECSDAEKQARIFLTTFGIDYDAITKEQFINLIEVLKLSKHMKSPTNQRGKARPYQPHGKGNGNANKQKNTPYSAFEVEYGVFFR